MVKVVKGFWRLLKATALAWYEDEVQRLGAALAFYTVLALPPLFVIVFFIAGLLFDAASARAQIFDQINQLIGEPGGKALQSVLANPQQQTHGVVATGVAIITLLLTTTGVFLELQSDLNRIWGVQTKPGRAVLGFLRDRLLSFALIVGIGFLLLVSLIVSAALAALNKYFGSLIPAAGSFWQVVNLLVSLGVITVMFALIFKTLPDVEMALSDVWVGAVITAVLFTAGKSLLGLYLGRSTIATAYGAAGSVIIILLWVYYSAQILFFGAEFTQVYACRFGKRMKPARHARWIDEEGTAGMRDDREPEVPSRLGRQQQMVRSVSEKIHSWQSVKGR
ncbi:MAG: Ribonuclease [Pedosphaera sp.]|nr:Ribonuclease [Pedosphaera sp.]